MHSPPELLDHLERCILAFERDGEAALAAAIAAAGPLAAEVRHQLDALRQAGLLHPPEMPAAIGGWRIKRRLGTGGMGSVFLGERTEPIARLAAIKVIRAGMDSHEVLARFSLERRALAMLDHPGIARILDAGSTDQGRPYLVMDYVAGIVIDRYCDERQLDTASRLELFARVCDAVQHAHQKGLLHRDLKPGNILVADRDGAAFPVVIDFGVAKSVGPGVGTATLTLPGRLLGTPEYMSPEQADNRDDVDTRADVYSLGVVLYELLTGKLPFDARKLRTDVGKVLRESEPPTPSTRITTIGDEATTIATHRRTSVAALRKRLRGDLDWIVMKALDRDRNRRYSMPAELAADVRRHLAREPVMAGPPTARYRLQKLCARYRVQVAAAGLVLVSLVLGLAASTYFWQQANANARQSAASLDAALAAVGELVQVGDSDLVAVPHLEHVRRDLLQRAVTFYRDFLATPGRADEPLLLARTTDALLRLCTMEAQLGQLDASERHLATAIAMLDGPAAAAMPEVVHDTLLVQALLQHATLTQRRAQHEQVLATTQRALAVLDRAATDATLAADRLQSRVRLLTLRAGAEAERDVPQALATIEQAAAALAATTAAAPPAPGTTQRALELSGKRAELLARVGRPDEALAVVRDALARRQSPAPGADWFDARATMPLIAVLHQCEQPDEVLKLANELRPTTHRFVEQHPSIVAYRTTDLQVLNHIANAHMMKRDSEPALSALRSMRTEADAALALAPQDVDLLRLAVIACINVGIVHDDGRRVGRPWDETEVEAAVSRGLQLLDALPTAEIRRAMRRQRLEILRIAVLLHESRREHALALERAEATVAIARELADAAPSAIDVRTRLVEMQRLRIGMLLELGRTREAVPIVEETLAASEALEELVPQKARWHTRHRELLLLALRAHAGADDAATAQQRLAEHQEMGPAPPGDAPDWLGRQEEGRALTKVIAALPDADPARQAWLACGRRQLDLGLACADENRARGVGHSMILVMTGNTWLIRRDLEAAAGQWGEAAAAATAAADAFATSRGTSPNDRSEQRLLAATGSALQLLGRAGDSAGLAAATARAEERFAARADALATLAAACLGDASTPPTPTVRAASCRLLRAARAAGLPAAAVQEPRFAALRDDPTFPELLQ